MRWYVWHAQSYGVWDDKGLINVIYSKIPFSATYRTFYSAGKLKSVGGVTITFNGRPVNFKATHFDPYRATYRLTQARDLVTYMRGFAENRIVLGEVLSPASRTRITEWLIANTTGNDRIRAGLPKHWRVGDKTGTGDLGATNDVGVAWPPDRQPFIVSVYYAGSTAAGAARSAVIAEAARIVSGA